ncbi:hypothetical protein SCRM01_024 [Synechococcus phage S-CRM01]|uniref:hypothetical protein n=1 Tax=Synechococcus phage S-CRM01 TaxID=1026955 RepID=UPI000209E342|nr:hypothetical protein SCRM01_024 [Synechococcus phage S-CRM01]AEC52971.1 hypothetical protein SCRM01_024 [Synechococcus phage S-CRM01]
MSLIIINPFRFNSLDADAQNYIDRVESADGSALESTTKNAIFQLFADLKATRTWRSNSITLWDKIGYCLPLCGPRTIAGAMIPLENLTASTASGTASMNWNRKTGLAALNTTNTPRVDIPYADNNNDANDSSIAVKLTSATTTGTTGTLVSCNGTGTKREIHRNSTTNDIMVGQSTTEETISTGTARTVGWRGLTRIVNTEFTARVLGTDYLRTRTSVGTSTSNFRMFYRTNGLQFIGNNGRLQGLQIGADLDLAAYESVMDTYITAINSAF